MIIPYGKHFIDEDDIQAVVDVLKGPFLTQGLLINEFEESFAEFVGSKYAVAVSSGTAALHLTALVSGIEPQKKSVTTPITFVSTANATRFCGGDCVFVDIDPYTLNIDTAKLKLAIEKDPTIKAIYPVHFAGYPCDMEIINNISEEYNLIVVEDAAHALGALYKTGEKVGSNVYSDMAIFSFHPVKAIAAGEGGMITTNNKTYYLDLLRLRSHGINKLDDAFVSKQNAYTGNTKNPWYYEMQKLGYHYRITDIQCALALSQLKKLSKFMLRRKELAKKYDELFRNCKNLKPYHSAFRDFSGHHLYILNIDFDTINLSRAVLMNKLRAANIGTQVHYMPVPMHPYYRNLGFDIKDYPVALSYYENCLSIPLYYSLTNDEQIRVVKTFKDLVG